MVIPGKQIADSIYNQLAPLILKLKQRNLNPTLAIILVGSDPASVSYVTQKKKKGEKIGITVFVDKKPEGISEEQLLTTIKNYNTDPNIHGIIVQLPLPKNFTEDKIVQQVLPEKDVDGFTPISLFINPIVKAIYYLFAYMIDQKTGNNFDLAKIEKWLINKQIIVIGKGKTAGKPIYEALSKLSKNITQIDSKTLNPDKIINEGDIVISCVGRKNIVNRKNIKKGVILINVGLHKENHHLMGDYDEEEIKDIASFYTPTPGGVGPINVACLLENVIIACER
ncbi:MAG: bifunctional 5,10-methylenetetrahydrofolate dehydrogenase/5,10-methenyltetrahydrofolate cyclohydrolase [Patescibacteria group bacterium]|nr:bifunctional 5,10-methylenetetrahydrofolate dehydrogenase/5,10-methenyltetrahydrofolate cyclohydrolase [Patescibacteria group bacterium]